MAESPCNRGGRDYGTEGNIFPQSQGANFWLLNIASVGAWIFTKGWFAASWQFEQDADRAPKDCENDFPFFCSTAARTCARLAFVIVGMSSVKGTGTSLNLV